MKVFMSKSILVTLFLLLTACVKQPVINQGQTIDSDSISKIRKGMSQEQIRLILGSPALIDIFDSNQWTYYYSNAKINQKRITEQGNIQLIFNDNALERIINNGNLVVKSDDANLQGGTVITKPTQKKRGIFNRIF